MASLRKRATRSGKLVATLAVASSSSNNVVPFRNAVLLCSAAFTVFISGAAFGFAPTTPAIPNRVAAARNNYKNHPASPPFHIIDARQLQAAASARPMEIWIDARQEVRGDVPVSPSRLSEADAIILGSDDEPPPPPSLTAGLDSSLAVYHLIDRPRPETDEDLPPLLFRGDVSVGALLDVSDHTGQDAATGLVGSVEWILITCHNASSASDDGNGTLSGKGNGGDRNGNDTREWLMIPAENLISACQGTGTQLAAYVRNAGDVGGLSRALELGVDALCVEASSSDDELWDAVVEAREERRRLNHDDDESNQDAASVADDAARPSLVQGRCRRLQAPGGKRTVLADRVCVDLVRSLKPTEGCWVGSSAKLTTLVLSEAAASTYVPSRPFRVNAGPVHSYIVMGDGASTKYLSELRAGDDVLVYDVEAGVERSVAVGRLKVEVRPCVMVGLTLEGKSEKDDDGDTVEGQVFLQQAETVRLGQSLGETSFVRVTDLGDEGESKDVLLRAVSMGTHVGKAYAGKVVEE